MKKSCYWLGLPSFVVLEARNYSALAWKMCLLGEEVNIQPHANGGTGLPWRS